MGRLAGKVAVVTGGASGIGLAIVERFVLEGASVVICDLPIIDAESLGGRIGEAANLHHTRRVAGGPNDGSAIADRLGEQASFVPADVTDPAEFAAVFEAARQLYGGLDVLVASAGVAGVEGDFLSCPEATFDRTFEVNTKALWRGMQLATPLLRERGGGAIINVVSITGLVAGAGNPAYSASKGAALRLTESAALTLAADRIRVNALCPGRVVTPLSYDHPERGLQDLEQMRARSATSQPIPDPCEPELLTGTAVWLASDDAKFVTGQPIVVDGGCVIDTYGHRPTGTPASSH